MSIQEGSGVTVRVFWTCALCVCEVFLYRVSRADPLLCSGEVVSCFLRSTLRETAPWGSPSCHGVSLEED